MNARRECKDRNNQKFSFFKVIEVMAVVVAVEIIVPASPWQISLPSQEKDKMNESQEGELDNPYLRPVKMPRKGKAKKWEDRVLWQTHWKETWIREESTEKKKWSYNQLLPPPWKTHQLLNKERKKQSCGYLQQKEIWKINKYTMKNSSNMKTRMTSWRNMKTRRKSLRNINTRIKMQAEDE